MTRGQYQTRNRKALMEYFQETGHEHFTVNDVGCFFDARGEHIGITSLYRQLEKMVDEGIVNKYSVGENSPACFAYIGEHSHDEGKENCFHCRCEKCGRLFHIHCTDLDDVAVHLKQHHGFKLNPLRTVFYGLCEECLNNEKNQ